MENKFNLQQRSISETLTESFSETQTITYVFSYEHEEKPKSISFYLSNNDNSSFKIVIGSYHVESGQLDMKTATEVEEVGSVIEHIKSSITEIITKYYK